jgi:hypothetical protein
MSMTYMESRRPRSLSRPRPSVNPKQGLDQAEADTIILGVRCAPLFALRLLRSREARGHATALAFIIDAPPLL